MRWWRVCGGVRALLLVLALGAGVPLAAAPGAAVPAADTGMQARIAAVVEQLNAAGTDAERQAALEAVAELGGAGGRAALVEQLTLFLAAAPGTEEAMGGAVLLQALAFERREIVAGTVPYMLDSTPEVNRMLRQVAATAVRPGEDDPLGSLLQVEAWRRGEAEEDAASIQRRLAGLARAEAAEIREYAATVAAAGGRPVKP